MCLLQNHGSLGHWHDNHPIAVDNHDIPGEYGHAGTLDGNVDLSITGDCTDIWNNALSVHRKPDFPDLLNVPASAIDDSRYHPTIESRHCHVLSPKGGV